MAPVNTNRLMTIPFVLLFLLASTILLFANPGPAWASNEEKVALVMKALSNPFFFKMEEGARAFAKKNGIHLEVFGLERETDVKEQIGIVKNLIAQKYGAIVIAPADSVTLVPICKKAMEQGIPVINIDNPLNRKAMQELGVSIPFVGPDNDKGAQLVGKYIRDKLGDKCNYFVIEGIRGVENADLRKRGFIEAMSEKGNSILLASETANWHTDEAFSVATRLLQKYPSVDAIFCANDSMALGVLKAINILGMNSRIMVGGYDNIDEVRNEMRLGKMDATAEQHPELMGETGVDLAWGAIHGKSVPDYVSTPVDLVTRDTFGKEVYLCVSNKNDPFFEAIERGASKAADLNGIALTVMDAKNDSAMQLTQIIRAVEAKPAAIIINPTDTEMILPGIEKANERRIPVITVDRKTREGSVLCYVGSDNHQGGLRAGQIMAKLLHGKGRIVEIEGIPGTSAAQERAAGFNEEILKNPDLKIVERDVANFNRQEARDAVSRLLAKGTAFDGIFAHNDNMILGALDALLEAGKSPLPVLIGFDAIDEAREEVRKGRLSATIAQNPDAMGRLAVDSAAEHLRGQQVDNLIRVDLLEVIP